MLDFLKKLFGFGEKPAVEATAPYKVETPSEPVKCGCGRSATGFCVGLHKLTPDQWDVHPDNPNKVVKEEKSAGEAKPAAKKKAPAKAKKPAATTPKKPRAKKTVQ